MGIEVFERQAAEFRKQLIPQGAHGPVGRQIGAQGGHPVEEAAHGDHGGDEQQRIEQGAPISPTALRP